MIAAEHFCERHGLVIIVALGESIVVIGARRGRGVRSISGSQSSRCSRSRLSAVLWWLYFRDEGAVEHAMVAAPPARRARLALVGFGYWHYGLLLGVVAIAAGLKKAVGDPYDPLGRLDRAGARPSGVALFAACTVGFRTTLGIGVSRSRLVAAAAALATIPIGTEWSAAGQLAVLTAIVVGALLVEARREFDLVQRGR